MNHNMRLGKFSGGFQFSVGLILCLGPSECVLLKKHSRKKMPLLASPARARDMKKLHISSDKPSLAPF